MRAPLGLLLVVLGLTGGALVIRAALEPSSGAAVMPAGGAGPDAPADGPGAADPAVSTTVASPARQVEAEVADRPMAAGRNAPAPDESGGETLPAPRTRRDQLARAWIEERAMRFANELALAAGAERRIVEILLEADRRMEEVRREARALGGTDRERVRVAAEGVRAWRDAAFEQEFGAELGRRIVELEEAPVQLGEGLAAPPSSQDEAGESPPD